jgi:acetyltransferase-like isoleucine patch superfamily enzyme
VIPVIQYGKNSIGQNSRIFEPVTIGFPSREYLDAGEFPGVIIGENSILRSGTIIYCNVTIGDHFSTGHNVLIREKMAIGDRVAIGSSTIVEGYGNIGNDVRIQSMAFIPTNTTIGNHVFIGPHAILTNDRYPPTGKPELIGPILEDYAVIGANAILMPGITIGARAAVAAGSIVTRDVPPGVLALGSPARFRNLPQEMRSL